MIPYSNGASFSGEISELRRFLALAEEDEASPNINHPMAAPDNIQEHPERKIVVGHDVDLCNRSLQDETNILQAKEF
ncbi:hypothetical protein E4U52_002585 [Claviceps spartinae]|nr:hypothetical protein E4U52_002585 [Claviceps spartinae]